MAACWRAGPDMLWGGRISHYQGAFVLRYLLILSLWVAPWYCRAEAPAPFQAPATAATSTPAAVTAIRAGRLLDVESGRTLSNQVILVSAGKIQAVGASVQIPEAAKVIDLSKMTVLPGLIDCHTHLADLADAEPLKV